jgi:hypothetical protein
MRDMKRSSFSNETFYPQPPKTPRTPKRPANRAVLARIRGSTEPLRKAPSPMYEAPRPLTRPFFPCQVSDLRRAGSAELPTSQQLDSMDLDESLGDQSTSDPSGQLFVLANVASDAAQASGGKYHSVISPGQGSGLWRKGPLERDITESESKTSVLFLYPESLVVS